MHFHLQCHLSKNGQHNYKCTRFILVKKIISNKFFWTQKKIRKLPLATATFEANSVNTWANKQIRNRSAINGKSFKLDKYVPNMADIPDSLPPRAKANPPPSKKINDQGMFALMYFHVIKLGVAAFGKSSGLPLKNFNQLQLAGNINSAITMKMAGVASPILVFVINSAHPVIKPAKYRTILVIYGDSEYCFSNEIWYKADWMLAWSSQEE